jgi:hypothetical protein
MRLDHRAREVEHLLGVAARRNLEKAADDAPIVVEYGARPSSSATTSIICGVTIPLRAASIWVMSGIPLMNRARPLILHTDAVRHGQRNGLRQIA